jgi:hypothetical protein
MDQKLTQIPIFFQLFGFATTIGTTRKSGGIGKKADSIKVIKYKTLKPFFE